MRWHDRSEGANESESSDPAFWSRFQFGFALTHHYIFPQLTMGLAWFLVYWKWRALGSTREPFGFWGQDLWTQFRPNCRRKTGNCQKSGMSSLSNQLQFNHFKNGSMIAPQNQRWEAQ